MIPIHWQFIWTYLDMDCLRENNVLHSKTEPTLKLNMEIEIRKPGEEERIRQRGEKAWE